MNSAYSIPWKDQREANSAYERFCFGSGGGQDTLTSGRGGGRSQFTFLNLCRSILKNFGRVNSYQGMGFKGTGVREEL